MGREEISGFLTHLAVDERLSASTQNQAFNALLFLYKMVLGADIGSIGEVVRADRPRRLPVVLTHEEVGLLFRQLDGTVLLVCRLLYGSGLRLLEALRMRVKDLDFLRLEIMVRDGKGGKDRDDAAWRPRCDGSLCLHHEGASWRIGGRRTTTRCSRRAARGGAHDGLA